MEAGGWTPFPSVLVNASPWDWPAPVRPVAVCGTLGTQLRASCTHRTDPTERAIGRTARGTACWRVNPRLPCGRIIGQPHLTSQGLAVSCPLSRRKDDAGGPRQSLSGRLGTSLCTTPGAKGAGSAGPMGAPRSGRATEEERQSHVEGGRPYSALAIPTSHEAMGATQVLAGL